MEEKPGKNCQDLIVGSYELIEKVFEWFQSSVNAGTRYLVM
jgi:hypothetical protein